jgi:hypothetical protein
MKHSSKKIDWEDARELQNESAESLCRPGYPYFTSNALRGGLDQLLPILPLPYDN